MLFEKYQGEAPAARLLKAAQWRFLRAQLRQLPPEVRRVVMNYWNSPRLKSTRTPSVLQWLISSTIPSRLQRKRVTFAEVLEYVFD